ncbi:MAG: hypothetical protein V4494_07700 [Chlamydiota bacterium]
MSQQDQNDNSDKITRVSAILSLNRGLLGEVAPSLRAAKIKWDDEMIYLYFYYDGEISEEDRESAECVATEVIADFSDYNKLDVNIIRWDYPQTIPMIGETVYLRRDIAIKELSLPQQDQNDNSDKITWASAILSLNRRLWGEVGPTLRAAKIEWDDEMIHLYFYYDGEISEEDWESAECVATEVISDFPNHKLDVNITRWDYPQPIPSIGKTVYLRREA